MSEPRMTLDPKPTRLMIDEALRVAADTMLDAFGACEAVRDDTSRIVDFEIVYVNEHAAHDLGVPRGDQIGRRLCEVFPDVVSAGRFAKYAAVVDTGVALVENEIERRGRLVDIRVSRLGDGFIAIWRDVTAQRAASSDIIANQRVEQELRHVADQRERLLASEHQARADAEAASRAKDQFLATISHELRTPLTAVLGYLQMLQKGVVTADRQAAVLDTISRNAQLQLQLIDDILDVSGIIRGKLSLDVRRVMLDAIVLSALDTIAPAAQAKQLDVARDLEPIEAPVDGDVRRLHQVFSNVLANAVKFTPGGGRIAVTMRGIDRWLEVAVTDTGPGIPPEFLPHMFEPFTQAATGSARAPGGLGLGLNIARLLIERHGGTIAAESEGIGRGATFRIRLPRAHAS